MKTNNITTKKRRITLKQIISALIVIGLVGAATWHFTPRKRASSDDQPLYQVKKSPLEISVSSTGTIQSRNSQVVRSMAKGRNTIIWVIEEGKVVTNGQLLVTLDSSELEKERDQQEITVANANDALTQAVEKLEIAKIDKESKLSQAELKLMLSKMSHEKYHQGEYPQQLQDAESKITMAQEEVERAKETLGWTEKLAAEGFVTRSDLQADQLSLRQKEISLRSAVTSMNLLTNFTAREQRAKLTADVEQAERELDRTQRETKSNIAQVESNVSAKRQEAERQLDRLNTLKDQVAACKITAPTNGLVIYASTMQASKRRWGGEPLAVGSQVYQSQDLIFIPISGEMVVQFNVPESELSKLQLGLDATISVDAIPDFFIGGKLTKIGLLPDGQNAWLNPDMNVYNCEISINGDDPKIEQLRAGMSCNISMQIASYKDVYSIPMQCVLRVKGSPSVFMLEDGKPTPHPVSIGYDNGRLIHIKEGIKEGDEIMLTPPLDIAEKADESNKPPVGMPGGQN